MQHLLPPPSLAPWILSILSQVLYQFPKKQTRKQTSWLLNGAEF